MATRKSYAQLIKRTRGKTETDNLFCHCSWS